MFCSIALVTERCEDYCWKSTHGTDQKFMCHPGLFQKGAGLAQLQNGFHTLQFQSQHSKEEFGADGGMEERASVRVWARGHSSGKGQSRVCGWCCRTVSWLGSH